MAMPKLLIGNIPDIISANVKSLKDAGHDHASATRHALKHASKSEVNRQKKLADFKPVGAATRDAAQPGNPKSNAKMDDSGIDDGNE